MNVRVYLPLYERREPTVNWLAELLLSLPDLLRLRTRRLVADLMQRFGVAQSTAMRAVSRARVNKWRVMK